MQPHRKRRLMTVMTLVLGVGTAAGVALYALSQNINLYLTPQQLYTQTLPPNQTIRVGGVVVKGSVHTKQLNTQQWITFDLTDFHRTVSVRYRGLLPSLFREGQGIVAEGTLTAGHLLMASQVLAKHDANYHPPGVPR